jgi:hypothetical protein
VVVEEKVIILIQERLQETLEDIVLPKEIMEEITGVPQDSIVVQVAVVEAQALQVFQRLLQLLQDLVVPDQVHGQEIVL